MTTATTEREATPKATGGRPRSQDADRRILQAAFRLLTEDGYATMSMDGVAALAGVSKPTIYRRYASKRELAVAAMMAMTRIEPPPVPADIGSDLLGLLKQGREALVGNRALMMIGTLLVEERREPELMSTFRERLMRPRRAVLRSVIEDAKGRGDLRADVDPEVVMDVLIGAQMARYLSGEPVDDAWLGRLLETVWPAIAP